ncbi:single-stranded-DNA-specific exonuclease RecJ [Saccharicrinis fermentans]|uniref:Single-stranded-DNA-specific exonuclease RecJ n=1 Tax=Saccharicrinis fermentans DSM 9555 = JCM 21142 TaxID=869213 RepID=W7XV05_9BACT|nr:single-stranded-DNA-specific exonuclease RecJ [Saccharicrinis fermentans]GAF01895.1 single-stranded-DNA-specific exonuclease RecJ [Saccharicrinis fermentans DSM 9555 = JCM 21142]
MEKRWNIKETGDKEKVEHLSKVLNIDRFLSNLLVQRGVETFDEAKAFFRPSYEHLHDPFLMKDMNKAIDRLEQAIEKDEKVVVYGDYDVDGTTSVSLVYSFLKPYFKNISFYIPNRYEEGYGISYKGIDYFAEEKCTLVIALDCGIKAVDKMIYAKEKGIEFIICDHHTPGDILPEAAACLDPKRPDCNYPDENLSGCGVGFKFLQAFCKRRNLDHAKLYDYLDLVAVSIASDIVPIAGENRVLAHFGLEKLNTNPSMGLKHIIKVAGMQGREITISDIVFKIGPRINAAGRIDSGNDAVNLLVSTNEANASSMSIDIDKCNDTRKGFDRDITQQALDLIANDADLRNRKSTVLYEPQWHKGVIGIVASRLTETYYRPTVILTESKGFATGSARSVEGFDLYKAIDACSDLLENFGGHMYAAGLTLKIENIPAFKERFEQYVAETITPDQMIPQIEVDEEIGLKDINDKFFRILKQFRPFGPGNLRPVFVTKRVFDYGTSKKVGKDQDHLKVELIEEKSGSIKQGIAFSMGDYLDKLQTGNPFDVCYTIEENVYNGRSTLQMMLKDMKFPYAEEYSD